MKKILSNLFICFLTVMMFSCKHDTKKQAQTPYDALQQKLCTGWNTWNTNSVLSHVLLPEAFSINLAIKNSGLSLFRGYLNSFYKSNSTSGRPESIKLGKRTDDGTYTELEMEWDACVWRKETHCKILVRTAVENNEQYILVKVLEVDKLRPPHLIIETGVLWNRPNGEIEKKGNKIVARFPEKNIVVGTSAQIIDDAFVTCNSPYLAVKLEDEIGIYTGKTKSLEEIKQIVNKHEDLAQKQYGKFNALASVFKPMQTILAWNAIYDPEQNRVISPVSRIWSSYWGGYVLFDWDTYFASLMYAVYNKDLAYANLVEVTRGITPSGFIPNSQSAYHILSNDRSQPPVGSLSALIIYKKYSEKWILNEVYPNLLKWNRWWPKSRDTKGFLCWGSDSVANLVDGVKNSHLAAAYESGLDNSPMYDDVPFNKKTNMLELADVGLMSLYIADCKALAQIATILNKTDDANELTKRADEYSRSLEKLWDEKTISYLNKRTDNNEWSYRLSPVHFYPLLAQVPSQERASDIVSNHFMNPAEFMGDWIIPSIARNDKAYNDQEYWRGRIWAPMNFLVYLGMRNYKLPEARKILVDKSLSLLLKSWDEKGAIYENYNSITGRGDDVQSSDGFYHWGALLGLISFIENGYLPDPFNEKTSTANLNTSAKK